MNFGCKKQQISVQDEPATKDCQLRTGNFVIDGTSIVVTLAAIVVTLAAPRDEPVERGPAGPPGYYNDFGYSYGYGRGGAGYGGSPGGSAPYYARDMYSSPRGGYGRPSYDAWGFSPPVQSRLHLAPPRWCWSARPIIYPPATCLLT
ncbi:hypothetical protein COOONC_23891 [Cooperia oncophora]